jgi:hypothetical protein
LQATEFYPEENEIEYRLVESILWCKTLPKLNFI